MVTGDTGSDGTDDTDNTDCSHNTDDGYFRRPHSTPLWLRKLAGLED